MKKDNDDEENNFDDDDVVVKLIGCCDKKKRKKKYWFDFRNMQKTLNRQIAVTYDMKWEINETKGKKKKEKRILVLPNTWISTKKTIYILPQCKQESKQVSKKIQIIPLVMDELPIGLDGCKNGNEYLSTRIELQLCDLN